MMTEGADPAAANFWGAAAAAIWPHFGPPLRPCAADCTIVREVLDAWAAEHGRPRVLLLGLTPEVYQLAATRGWDLVAVDRAPSLIEAVWQGPAAAVRCADWTALPLDAGTRDVAILDGGVQMLAYPDGQRRLGVQLRRVLAPGGLFVCRMFALPAVAERPAEVIAALGAGRVPNVHALKLRLGMALQQDPRAGVAMREVWTAVTEAEPDLQALARRLGWSREQLSTLYPYRDSANRYYYTDVGKLSALLCEDVGGFELAQVCVPDYPLGERCPTVVLRRLTD